MSYDHNKYTEVGVGNTVRADHFAVDYPASVMRSEVVIRPVYNYEVGSIVTEDLPITYLQVLPAADKTIFPTGAARSNADGRGRFDLVPYEAILALARRFEMGAVQFGENNWLKGQPLSRLLSSMRRHAHQINYDFSEDHLGAVLWNAAAFVTMVSRIEAGLVDRSVDDIGWFQNKEASKQ
jgi:hypothetical protein